MDLVFSLLGYERTAIERAVGVEVGGVTVRFASVEDLLVHKLIAGRPRDIEDARGVLLRHPEADHAYVRRWLATFDAALDQSAASVFERLLSEPE